MSPPSEKKKLASLRALGAAEPPDLIILSGTTWRRTETFKHDFFAATAFYANDAGQKAVLKIGRPLPFWGFPLAWLGRWLCARESRFYLKLQDLPPEMGGIPRYLGRVNEKGEPDSQGVGFLHSFIEGRPLNRKLPTPDGYFAKLEALFREIHGRNIAYVDTNKPQNILLGDDGLPYLIDFQISFDRNRFPTRWLLRRFQREDLYHLLKHRRRMRPDELTPEQLAQASKVSPAVKLHRILTWPYFKIRRALFRKLEKDGRLLPSGSD